MSKWDEKELMEQVDHYFDTTSPEQFDKDLEKTGCKELVEKVQEE
jgi:hypothetical protein